MPLVRLISACGSGCVDEVKSTFPHWSGKDNNLLCKRIFGRVSDSETRKSKQPDGAEFYDSKIERSAKAVRTRIIRDIFFSNGARNGRGWSNFAFDNIFKRQNAELPFNAVEQGSYTP